MKRIKERRPFATRGLRRNSLAANPGASSDAEVRPKVPSALIAKAEKVAARDGFGYLSEAMRVLFGLLANGRLSKRLAKRIRELSSVEWEPTSARPKKKLLNLRIDRFSLDQALARWRAQIDENGNTFSMATAVLTAYATGRIELVLRCGVDRE